MVRNPGVSKKTKSSFFNQFALKQVATVLLDHTTSVATTTTEGPAEHVREVSHQLLCTLCMDTQLGICYKPRNLPFGLERCV